MICNKPNGIFKITLYMITVALMSIIAVPQADAFWSSVGKGTLKTISVISKSSHALSTDKIIKLSKLSDEVKGTKKVGKYLGKLNLPKDVIEDTYLRIAIYQQKLSREEAIQLYAKLNRVPGFRQTIRKVIGNNKVGTKGHLNELAIAKIASTKGFKVLGIGQKFNDGVKKGLTDIDILIKKGSKTFAIEAKAYAATTKIPMDKYRGDLDTLVRYKREQGKNIVPVFAMTNTPTDPRYLKTLQHEADKRGVQLIFGSPQTLTSQLNMLGEIL